MSKLCRRGGRENGQESLSNCTLGLPSMKRKERKQHWTSSNHETALAKSQPVQQGTPEQSLPVTGEMAGSRPLPCSVPGWAAQELPALD